MASVSQNIVLHLDTPPIDLEILPELVIATHNATPKLICHIVAHQVPAHKIRLDEETYLTGFTSTRAKSQFNHL